MGRVLGSLPGMAAMPMRACVALLVALTMVFAGCTEDDGCGSDSDCKGDRICRMHECVDPGADPDAGATDAGGDARATDAMSGTDAAQDAGLHDAASDEDASMVDAGAQDASDDAMIDASIGPSDIQLVDGGDYLFAMERSFYFSPEPDHSSRLANMVDASSTYALPFPFPYYGTTYPAGTTLTLTSNGTVWLGDSHVSGDNTALPQSAGPHGMIAPFWDQLVIYDGVRISSTADTLRIEYMGLNFDTTVRLALTLKRSGVIELRYLDISGILSATVGLESPDGAHAVELDCSPVCASIPSGTVLTFIPRDLALVGPDLEPRAVTPTLPMQRYPNEAMDVVVDVVNHGNVAGGETVWLLRTEHDPSSFDFYFLPSTATTIGVQPLSRARTEPVDVPFSVSPGVHDYWVWIEEDDLFPQNNTLFLGTVQTVPYLGSVYVTSPSPLPSAQVGLPYSQRLTATGASDITWSPVQGLPGGLTLSQDGLLSGTPQYAWSGQINIRAQAYGYEPQVAALSLIIQ